MRLQTCLGLPPQRDRHRPHGAQAGTQTIKRLSAEAARGGWAPWLAGAAPTARPAGLTLGASPQAQRSQVHLQGPRKIAVAMC